MKFEILIHLIITTITKLAQVEEWKRNGEDSIEKKGESNGLPSFLPPNNNVAVIALQAAACCNITNHCCKELTRFCMFDPERNE